VAEEKKRKRTGAPKIWARLEQEPLDNLATCQECLTELTGRRATSTAALCWALKEAAKIARKLLAKSDA
jgi:hypothetical protein